MCFSASASFTASAVLAVIGTALVIHIKNKRLLPLAMIPWFFAFQQSAEGIVWLHLPEPSSAKNVFLFFAFAFWPIWIPFSLWLAEDRGLRKEILAICFGMGIVLGVFLTLQIPQTMAMPYRNSIHYLSNSNANMNSLVFPLYCITTVFPLFLSSIKKVWVVGMLTALSGIVIYWIDHFFFASVWCFFAAIFSLTFYFILQGWDHQLSEKIKE